MDSRFSSIRAGWPSGKNRHNGFINNDLRCNLPLKPQLLHPIEIDDRMLGKRVRVRAGRREPEKGRGPENGTQLFS